MDHIESIVARPDAWRHLPAYQLERRADIFFAHYLPGVLADVDEEALHLFVIAELPMHRAVDNGPTTPVESP